MKKVILGMFIACMGVFMVSCSNGGGIEKAKQILNELKEKGATMDKAAVKEKLLAFIDAVKPVAQKFQSAVKDADKDPQKLMKLMEDPDLQAMEGLMTEFAGLEESIPAAKELNGDPDLEKAIESLNN